MLKSLHCSLPQFPRPSWKRSLALPVPSRRGEAGAFPGRLTSMGIYSMNPGSPVCVMLITRIPFA